MSKFSTIKGVVQQSKAKRIDKDREPADDQALTEPVSQPAATPTADTISENDAPKLGRPKTGKRSKPGFRSVSLWLKAETFADADELLRRRRRLGEIPAGQPRDVSELAESLIADWLQNQPSE